MQPKRITLHNVFQHTDLVHEFKTGITGVMGRNGSGKSNFLEAVHFAQTGNTGSEYTKGDLLSWGADRGHTIYEFSHAGADYKLTRNLHTSLVKLESDVLDKPLKAAEANAFMEAALGMSFKGFYETCWTPQGTLVDILTMSHAARVSFFQRLAHTREAETIRGIIQENGLNKLPTFLDRTLEITNMLSELVDLDTQVTTFTNSEVEFNKLFTDYQSELANVQGVMALPTQMQYDHSIAVANNTLTQARTSLAQAQSSFNLTEVAEADMPTPEMERAKVSFEQRSSLSSQLTQLATEGARLEGLLPAEVVDPEPIRVELEADNTTLLGMKPRYDLAQNKECPTCHRPYEFEGGDPARDAVIAEYHQKQTAYQQKHADYMQKRGAFDQRQMNARSIQASIDANTSQRQSVNAQLGAIAELPYDADAHQRTVTAHTAYVQYLQAKQQHDNQLRQLEQAVDRSQTALITAQDVVFASEDACAKANAFMTSYNEITEKRRLISADLSAATSRRMAIQEQKVRLEEEQEKRAGVAHVRSLFERAREKLHRDVLPKLVMQKMLYGLNSLLDQYLSVFDTNFTAHINEDFDFLCSFSTKSDVPARSLSGGQKVALALAFKFAVSDLTASSVPFLVLDEPTVWLDDINKPRLAEVLTKAREVTEKGVYVLVATHEPDLKPAFSRIFDVS